MKKRLLFMLTACAVAISAVLTAKSSRLKDAYLFEANVEALSDDEGFGPTVICYKFVSDSYDPELYIEVRQCSDCKYKKTSSASGQSTCNS